jgi:hypothetical protein
MNILYVIPVAWMGDGCKPEWKIYWESPVIDGRKYYKKLWASSNGTDLNENDA